MVVKRLAGSTENTAPVLTLITQFGGGKTHTLTALYHLAKNPKISAGNPGVSDLMKQAGLAELPQARVGVFVGNAWDPQPGRETPWIDIARQVAGDKGVEVLGSAAKSTPPGTEAISRVFEAAGASVLILFDEVLNFLNRHRSMSESFYAFLQNLCLSTKSNGRNHRHKAGRCGRELAAQPNRNDRIRSGLAGQDYQGCAASRQGSDRERRKRDQRSGLSAAL
jgi:predicted AAA+ superfamily ATPase